MIEPEIWTIKMADHPQDDFVRLSAYKALDLQKAELMVEIARLKAEVERLRFAGDILAFTLAHGDRQEYGDPSEPIEEYMNRLEIKGWLAAKEGKQSV